MKQIIVPFFISHHGCPHQCIFCDQRIISGNRGNLPSAVEMTSTISGWLVSAADSSLQVAFYGGSFTSLPLETQRELLLPLQQLRMRGKVSSIRVSTRPDALCGENVKMLCDLGVDLVELGVQSMDDRILAAAGRGHGSWHTLQAFNLLQGMGVKVGAQLMPGLPGDTAGSALRSFYEILALQPNVLRIYPAVVLKGTRLAQLYLTGSYRPQSLDEAVQLCKVMLHDADAAGVRVIRAGLQPTDDLSFGGEIVAGPYHPAFRQLAEGERWYDLLDILSARLSRGESVVLAVTPARISDVVGQKRINVRRIEEKYGIFVSGVNADATLGDNDLLLRCSGRLIAGNLLHDLGYSGVVPYKKERA